ncbi:phage terminase large subunit family protein [Streptantibioticus rubrisoli]|uniref:Phage terminase large subunit family protein n=1 Tax=Streptantibioticus rubrisoli TaxID=1387313 RepID=A0ABT1P8W8_9ACTN|nr:phage terminase large subunit family protein [Streptantibioticus rubrisoli]MCQ4041807.1 phage terminase large subunit family protein [Streptantibioticus rubrisoli]
MLPIDPSADIGRRAWVPCPHCQDHQECDACAAGRDCADHWRYLLSNQGRLLHLQCPNCTHVWSWDSGFGAQPPTPHH